LTSYCQQPASEKVGKHASRWERQVMEHAEVGPAAVPGTASFGPGARVLISINTSWNIYNFRAGLIRALVAAGHEVIAAAPPDAYSERLAELGCRYVPLPMDNKGTSPVNDLILTARYLRLFRRERPDVFLGYTIKPNIYGSLAARLLGIPVVNNISGLGTVFISDSWITHLVKRLYRAALVRSDRVFFQNEDDLAVFLVDGLVRREQTDLLPGSGIDLMRFRPQPSSRSGDGFRFLLAARLLWDKGIGEYVEAARMIKRTAPAAIFQLLGFLDVENPTAIDRASVEGWVAEGAIDYLGASDDIRPVLAAADCVVLPSYREGTPRSLLEAAAMAKPLIASDVPGCRQVVIDGENGLLCRARDSRDLAEKMLAMMARSPKARAAMGARSRARMEAAFDERIVIRRYLAAIKAARADRR
jgi:glycosyltransferase involved in cell wall biosynthesis